VYRSDGCPEPEIFAIKSQSCPKSLKNFAVLVHQFFFGGGMELPNFWPNFITYTHRWTCGNGWQWSAQRPPRIGGGNRDYSRRFRRLQSPKSATSAVWTRLWTTLRKSTQCCNLVRSDISPSVCVLHHDLVSPVQYVLSVPEVVNQSVSCLFFDGRPMSAKTANDPPRDKQSLLAVHHVSHDEVWNFL